MKTKLVYVLVSDENDTYLEQALISVYSARLHNPDATIVLLTDQGTLDTMKRGVRAQFLTYFNDVVTVDTSQFKKKAPRSRQIKTNVRNLVDGDYLYIDCDTVICDRLDDIDLVEHPFAMVLDRHIHKKDWPLMGDMKNRNKNIGSLEMDEHYNCGIQYVKDTAANRELFTRWNREWNENFKTGVVFDQPPFYKTVLALETDIAELDGVWNVQIISNALPYLVNAKIIHTFATDSSDRVYTLSKPEILWRIKQEDRIPDDVRALIESPKTAFEPISVMMGAKSMDLLTSKLYSRGRYFNRNARGYFHTLQALSKPLMILYACTHNIGSTMKVIKNRITGK